MKIELKEIGFKIPVATLYQETNDLCFTVKGIIGNFAATSDRGKRLYQEWKRLVASKAKSLRGTTAWNPESLYCITCGFIFHMPSHGNRKLDVENFIKPTLDALAAGLFCSEDQDPNKIERYDYDDSNFRFMFIQRLADAKSENDEGVVINISVQE